MSNIKILLVDDEERFLHTTAKLLIKKGYDVETAISGPQALEKLKRSAIQIVILDMKMPKMDGNVVLKKIKKNFPKVEVIILSGHGTIESAVQGVKLGAANYLLKPAGIDEISEKIQEAIQKQQSVTLDNDKRKKYFRKLKVRLRIGLLIAFAVPHTVFFFFIQYHLASTLKDTYRLNLEALSNSQKNTIDLFLQERVANIYSLFRDPGFHIEPTQQTMKSYLKNLKKMSDAFIDVGFLNSQGTQTGYAGSYPQLKGKNYRNEHWFQNLLTQGSNHYISDIYLGFREKVHFTIAVKQIINGHTYILRSTLDPDKFYIFLRSISKQKIVESALINKSGLYQIVDPLKGQVLTKSKYLPPVSPISGVIESTEDGINTIMAYSWLKETPWVLIVWQPAEIANVQMSHANQVIIIVFIIVFIGIAFAIWYSTGKLLHRAQAEAEKSDELKHQLFHASKLASVGQLATGVAHEINNPLAIIVSTSGVIRDMLNPEFDLNPSPEEIIKEVDAIDAAVFRARTITRQLLTFGRKNEPKIELCFVNQILDEVISGLKERELKIEDIELVKDFAPDLPGVLVDRDQLRQVFFNLINNAEQAISGPGKITLITRQKAFGIQITIKDTGKGISREQINKIFNPFYTTKEVGKGTGLGLSISLSIIESFGGTIDVDSNEASGSAFIITLPLANR